MTEDPKHAPGSASAAAPQPRVRLGEALVEAGVITPAQLETCLLVQRGQQPRKRLGEVVVNLGLATDEHVAIGLGRILGFDVVDPAALDVPSDVVARIPRRSAEALGVVPIAAGETWLRVAAADPTDRETIEALRLVTGVTNISLAVATPRTIAAAVARFWAPGYAPAEPAPDVAEEPDVAPEPVAEPARGWEYRFVGDGLPNAHPGFTVDLAGTERELAALGAAGWEAVGLQTQGAKWTVLLKRPRP